MLALHDMLLLCRRLVVEGLYRYTRNPMFWGAFGMVFGEALVFNSRHLLYYFLVVVAMQMVHVPLNEERWLRRGFGAEYEEYCRQVYHALQCTESAAWTEAHSHLTGLDDCFKRLSRCFAKHSTTLEVMVEDYAQVRRMLCGMLACLVRDARRSELVCRPGPAPKEEQGQCARAQTFAL